MKEKAPLLTLQDAREIMEVVLPKKDKKELSLEEVIAYLEQKHRQRLAARQSHYRSRH